MLESGSIAPLSSEVGIYKRKQESKKTRKQELDQERIKKTRKKNENKNSTWKAIKKKRKKQELDQGSDHEKRKNFIFFLIAFLVEILFSFFFSFIFFSYFLVFFYKFSPLVPSLLKEMRKKKLTLLPIQILNLLKVGRDFYSKEGAEGSFRLDQQLKNVQVLNNGIRRSHILDVDDHCFIIILICGCISLTDLFPH